MQIEFEATIDELVDLHVRATGRSRVARSWLRQGAALTALHSGLFWGSIVLIVTYTIWQFPIALILALITAGISAAVSWLVYRDRIRQRYYNYFREQFGNRDTFTFELELSEAGIWTRQFGIQNMFEWPNVEELAITEDAIEFYMYGGSAVSARKRAFASSVQQQEFIDAARQHLNVSRTSSNWLRAS